MGLQKKIAAALAALCFALAVGCSAGAGSAPENAAGEPSSQQSSQTESSKPAESFGSGAEEPGEPAKEAALFIGSDGDFQEYPWEYQGQPTPEALIAAISDLTGWNLTLADEVTAGKGGMTVCFSKESALFVGPPDPQKEEFFMFDAESLDRTILDSIQRTLQYNFVDPELGDPDSLDIYYCMEGNAPLTLPGINVTLPMDQPYKGFTVE